MANGIYWERIDPTERAHGQRVTRDVCGWAVEAEKWAGISRRECAVGAQVKVCLFFFLLFSFQTPFILDLKI
jgi:hypothetical protein